MIPFTSVHFVENITWSNKHPACDMINLKIQNSVFLVESVFSAYPYWLALKQFLAIMVKYHASKQANKKSKKTDFTVNLTWWGSLRLAPIISNTCFIIIILKLSRPWRFVYWFLRRLLHVITFLKR